MNNKKESSAEFINRSKGQKARYDAIRKARKDEIRRKAVEYLRGENRSASVGRYLSSNDRDVAASYQKEEDAGENWMVEETENSEGQHLFHSNHSSFEDDANGDHQNYLGGDTRGADNDEESDKKICDDTSSCKTLAKDIRNFFIPVADNFEDGEESAKLVKLLHSNDQNSSLAEILGPKNKKRK
jgi:hypothetical protein